MRKPPPPKHSFHALGRCERGRTNDDGLAIETAWPPMQASFLASLVEFVEALTVVFAVGTVRGWRPALAGTALAFAVLLTLVVVPWAGADAYPSRSRAASSSAPSCSCIDGWL